MTDIQDIWRYPSDGYFPKYPSVYPWRIVKKDVFTSKCLFFWILQPQCDCIFHEIEYYNNICIWFDLMEKFVKLNTITFAFYLTEKFVKMNTLTLHTVEIKEIYSHWKKKCRQINYLVISLVKTLLSRNFCHKEWE